MSYDQHDFRPVPRGRFLYLKANIGIFIVSAYNLSENESVHETDHAE